MVSALTQVVQSFGGRKALLIGDLILDRYLYGDAERISPEAPVPVLRATEQNDRVGGSANVAACLRSLGMDVVCCGVVGDDEAGRQLVALMEEMGVDASGVLRSGSRPTTTKTRLVGLAQHRHRQQLMRLDHESTDPLPVEEAGQIADFARKSIRDVDVVCIEDYDKGVISYELVRAVTAEAHRLPCPVIVDPARVTDYGRYQRASLITPNRGELQIAVGAAPSKIEDIAEYASRLCKKISAEAVVVTLDRDGALLAGDSGDYQHVPTRPRSVYDNTGAGDAVLAMLAAAVAAEADWLDAVRLANIAGGLEVEKFGCVPITADEVLADLRLEHERQIGKVRGIEDLLAELAIRRDRGETVVFTNGCFDILHAGHVDLLARARREGSLLVVALNSDASVRRQGKGEDRPINSQEHRAAVLGGLEAVDYVVLFDETSSEQIIKKVRPDVLVKGEDWGRDGVVGREFVESYGGRVALMPLIEGASTTHIIERIRKGAG